MLFDDYMKQFVPTHREQQAQARIDAELAKGRYGDPDDYEIIKEMLARKQRYIESYKQPTKEEWNEIMREKHPLPTDGMTKREKIWFHVKGVSALIALIALIVWINRAEIF